MAKLQVITEQYVGEGGSLWVFLRGDCQAGLSHRDHHVRARELLEESDHPEEVGDGQVVAVVSSQVEQVLCEECVLGNPCSCGE